MLEHVNEKLHIQTCKKKEIIIKSYKKRIQKTQPIVYAIINQ